MATVTLWFPKQPQQYSVGLWPAVEYHESRKQHCMLDEHFHGFWTRQRSLGQKCSQSENWEALGSVVWTNQYLLWLVPPSGEWGHPWCWQWDAPPGCPLHISSKNEQRSVRFWNNHVLRTERPMTPVQVFVSLCLLPMGKCSNVAQFSGPRGQHGISMTHDLVTVLNSEGTGIWDFIVNKDIP